MGFFGSPKGPPLQLFSLMGRTYLINYDITTQNLEASCQNYHPCTVYNKEIIPEVELVPKAQPRDTNNQGVLSLLATLGSKHILMAQKRKDLKKVKTFKKS